MRKVLAVIPARGGSKGIPRKNVRLMCNKPLIAYAINNAMSCEQIMDCVVSTDDDEIAKVATYYGSEVVRRGEKLSSDDITLDPVVYDATLQMESKHGYQYDIIVTLQATSPLLKNNTLSKALSEFIIGDADTMISVVNSPHLSWRYEENKYVPNYEKRLNRQQLVANYLETGAFFLSKRICVTATSRIGDNVTVFEVPADESIDIDSASDWIVSENLLKQKNILFRADGMKQRGMGHIYNCIAMAFSLIGHNVLMLTRNSCYEGLSKIKSTNLPYRVIDEDNEKNWSEIIEDFKPDIWVHDCLNSNLQEMKWLKSRVNRVVSIEDLGAGTEVVDAVINALYENHDELQGNFYEGSKYVLLRDEFLLEQPSRFNENVSHVLIMFGGTDPENLNLKLYHAVQQIAPYYPNMQFDFVTGIGYDADSHGVINDGKMNINIYKNISKVTEFMKKADIAVTSQGRTIYEIASMGIPAIVLSQNEREAMHLFATMKNGFLNLGLGRDVEPTAVANTLKWLIDTPTIRKNMRELMLKHNFRNNTETIKRIILGE